MIQFKTRRRKLSMVRKRSKSRGATEVKLIDDLGGEKAKT